MREESTYYPYFDVLRFALASVVMLVHDDILAWKPGANLSVQVFFALSGWLIGSILIGLDKHALPRFFFNRAARIWVPYFITLAIVICGSVLRDPINAKWVEIVVYKLTFTYNWFGTNQLATHVLDMPLDGSASHLWSVNAEEQFYLFAPLLLVFLPKRIGCAPLLWAAIAGYAWWTSNYGSIALGVLAAAMAARFPGFQLSTPARVATIIVLGGSAWGIVSGHHYERLAPLFSIAVVLLLAVPGREYTFGRFIGGISYPLYLNHWIGVFAANALLKPIGMNGPTMPRQVLATILALGIASGLYWFVDRRVLAARGQFFTTARGMSCAAVAYGLIVIGCCLAWTVYAG